VVVSWSETSAIDMRPVRGSMAFSKRSAKRLDPDGQVEPASQMAGRLNQLTTFGSSATTTAGYASRAAKES